MPSSYLGGNYAAVGSKIFVLGGYYNRYLTSDVLAVDCRYDIAQPFGTMPKLVIDSVSNVVDGKIYVIGGHYSWDDNKLLKKYWSSNRMMVFDTKTQT